MTEIDLDDNGFPVLLAPGSHRAPNTEHLLESPIAVRSGNPHRSPDGRFHFKPKPSDSAPAQPATNGKPSPAPAAPAGPPSDSVAEQHRREDAVRDAAREFETFNTQDLKDWLKGRITRPLNDAEVAAFEADVRAQQLADISDILDQMTLGNSRGRRQVKVKSPRGYLRKTLASLPAPEIKMLEDRLKARGWTDKQIKDGLHSRLPGDSRMNAVPAPASS